MQQKGKWKSNVSSASWLTALLLVSSAALTACGATPEQLRPPPPVVVPPPVVPKLPDSARQPPPPSICSPTCLLKWKSLVENWQQRLTGAETPASAASAPPTR